MSERGVFAVDRGIFDHPVLRDDAPFCKVKAWLWLLSEAAWKPHRIRRAGKIIDLERGQVAHSLRHMANEWQWTLKRVRVFIDLLKKDTMIDTDTGTGFTIITISKYDEYQRVSLPKGTGRGTDKGTRRAHEGHNIEDKEDKELPTNVGKHTPKDELLSILDAEHADALIEHRKKKRSPLTVHTAKLLAGKFAKCADPNAAADTMMVSGWQGFEPAWLEGRGRRQGGGFRQNGAGGYVKPGSAEFDAWWNKYKREQSSRQWEFAAAAKSGEEVKVDGRWPGRS